MAKEMNEYEIGEPSGESFSQISISNVVAWQWVIVNYIGKFFVGKVIPVGIEVKAKKQKKFVHVQCLSEPYWVEETWNLKM